MKKQNSEIEALKLENNELKKKISELEKYLVQQKLLEFGLEEILQLVDKNKAIFAEFHKNEANPQKKKPLPPQEPESPFPWEMEDWDQVPYYIQ